MKIKNDLIRIRIGKKKYDFHNLILDEYLKRFAIAQTDKDKVSNYTAYMRSLKYILLKFDTAIENLSGSSDLHHSDFDICIVNPAKYSQELNEKQIIVQYDYETSNQYIVDIKNNQTGILGLDNYYDKKVTAIGFSSAWVNYGENDWNICAVLDTSNYNIYLEKNQDFTITRRDIITTDAEFYSNDREKVPAPAHLAPYGLPQIIYQPSMSEEGGATSLFYDNGYGVLYSIGKGYTPMKMEEEKVIGEDADLVNNGTSLTISSIDNEDIETEALYPSEDLYPIGKFTEEIQTSEKGVKVSLEGNGQDAFVKTEGKSEQDGIPTPTNPSEIHSVGDDVNLFDINNLTVNTNMQTDIINNDLIIKRINTDGGYVSYKAENLEVGKDYIIKSNSSIYIYKDSVYGTLYKNTENASDGFVFKAEQNSYIIAIIIGSSDIPNIGDTINCGKIKLQKGTVATAFSEYNKGFIEIKQKGKSIFDLVPIDNVDFDFYQQCDTEYMTDEELNKTVLHITANNNYPTVAYNLQERLEKNKYYALKFKYKGIINLQSSNQVQNYFWIGPNMTANNWDNLGFFSDTKRRTYSSEQWIDKIIKFQVEEDRYSSYTKSYTKILLSLGYGPGTNHSNIISKEFYISDLMLCEISEEDYNNDSFDVGDYEPYFSNDYVLQISEPLRSLPNGIKDTIEADGIHRRVGKHIFTEVTKLRLWTTGAYYGVNNLSGEKLGANSQYLLSNKLVAGWTYKEHTCYITDKGQSLVVFGNNVDTIDTFNAKYVGAEIYYPLAEEIIEPFTEEQQEVLNSIETQKGTNIFYVDNELKPEIQVTEYKSLLYPIKDNYKYIILKYKVWQQVATGEYTEEDGFIQETTDTGYYYYQAVPLEEFGNLKITIKYERG